MRTVYPASKRTFEYRATTSAAAAPRSARTSAGEVTSTFPPELSSVRRLHRRAGEIPFSPVIPVPPDAAPYAQLAAWLGRQP